VQVVRRPLLPAASNPCAKRSWRPYKLPLGAKFSVKKTFHDLLTVLALFAGGKSVSDAMVACDTRNEAFVEAVMTAAPIGSAHPGQPST